LPVAVLYFLLGIPGVLYIEKVYHATLISSMLMCGLSKMRRSGACKKPTDAAVARELDSRCRTPNTLVASSNFAAPYNRSVAGAGCSSDGWRPQEAGRSQSRQASGYVA